MSPVRRFPTGLSGWAWALAGMLFGLAPGCAQGPGPATVGASPAALTTAATASVKTTSSAERVATAPRTDIRWTPTFQGVEIAQWQRTEPRLLSLVAARVDLKAPGLRWLATPPAAPGSAPLAPPGRHAGETVGRYTSSFLREHGLQLAINAAPFGPVVEEEGTLLDVAGLQVSQGRLVSGQTRRYPALMLLRDGQARIVEPPFDLEGVDNAVGGFDVVLKAGVPRFAPGATGTHASALHPRTAVGISADGRYLFLLVVDGRQPDFSLGVSLAELAAILADMGAAEGLNLDGGGTSTLVVQGAGGQAQVLNRPIHGGQPGRERVSASHLGLWALPLPPLAPPGKP